MQPGGPFTIPAINNFIPEKIKPWILILFVLIIQFSSGGIYLATLNQVVGDQALMQEDVLMAGYAALVGMALTFTIMLRLKMRFLSKTTFMVCCSVLIAANIICMYTQNVFILVATCFITGVFRMWATFECNSSIQLWITPTRDLSVFFCYIYIIVQGAILLGGSTHLYVTMLSTWQYVHWLMIGGLLFIMLMVSLIFNSQRFMRAFPLFGIDWLGMFLWRLILLCINFIAIYGEFYDWFDAWQIQIACTFLIVLLLLNLYRATFIRHPFIGLAVFKYKIVYLSVLVYFAVDLLIAPSHLIEEIYTHAILQYDEMHSIQLNLMSFLAVVMACIFSYFYFAKAKKSYKSTFMIGFMAIILYLLMMYLMLDYQTSFEVLAISIMFRNFGYVVISIVLLTGLTKVPFPHFFQALTIQMMMSAACGTAITGAILHHMFSHSLTENFQLLTMNMDRVNPQLWSYTSDQLAVMIPQHALLETFKELYGVLVLISFVLLILFVCYRYPYLPVNVLYPKRKTIRKFLKKEIS